MSDFGVYQGDDLRLGIDIAKQGVQDTTSGAELRFMILPGKGLPESRAIITKSTVGDEVTKLPPKTFRWKVSAEDLAALTVDRAYYWYVRYEGSDGDRQTMDEGRVTLLQGVKSA